MWLNGTKQQNSTTMLRTFRASTLALAAIFCGAAFAQPAPSYTVTISGTVLGCNSANGYVNVATVEATLPEIDIDVPLDPNCGWTVTLTMESYSGAFVASTPCGGLMVTATGQYQSDFLSTASISMTLDCVNNPPPCNACVSLAQTTTGGGPNGGGDPVPYSVTASNCSFAGAPPYTYTMSWDDGTMPGQDLTHVYAQAGMYIACLTITDPEGCTSMDCDSLEVDEDGTIDPVSTPTCEAGFFAMQAYEWVGTPGTPNGGVGEPIPNELWIWNLSTGGPGIFSYLWSFGDGTSSTEEFPSHTYASGEWELCLTINDGTGCTDIYCDMISVDADGILNGLTGGSGNRNAFTIRVMNGLSTSVGQSRIFTELTTWPNPVNNELNVSVTSELKGNVRVSITDMSGRLVINENRALTNGLNRMVVPVADLNAGPYMVELSNGTNTVSSRFVKVR